MVINKKNSKSTEKKNKLFNAYINPLAYLEVDEPWASSLNKYKV